LGRELRGHTPNIVRRADRVEIESDEVEAGEAAQQSQSLVGARAAWNWRAHSGFA